MNLNDLYEMRDPRDAYQRDVDNSTSGFGKNSQAYRADGGANDERHDLDQQSSTWYIRLNGKLIRDKSGNPYSFQNKAAANKAALTMQAKLFNKDKEFMLTTNPNDKSQGVAEAIVSSGDATLELLELNIFKDLIGEHSLSNYDEEFAQSPEWQKVVARWAPMAEKLYNAVIMLHNAGKKISSQEAKSITDTAYDGSDAYNDPESAAIDLPRIYKQQYKAILQFVQNISKPDMNMHEQAVAEGDDYSAVTGAITRRIITQHPEVLAKYGPAIVSQAIDEIADFVGDVDEIGSSDVSGWVSQVIRSLGRFAPVRDEGAVDSDGYSVDHADSGEYDYEGDQAKDQLNTIVRSARKLNGLLDDNENMPEWVQMKITNAADYIDTAADYIESNQEPELAEGNRVGNMDADAFDAAMARLKQLAGAGPMKTVYDPAKRVYRNVPTAVQPKK